MMSPPLPPSPRHFRWQATSGPAGGTPSSGASSALETPTTATTQISGGHCDWADRPHCTFPVQNKSLGWADMGNWQTALMIRNMQSYTNQGRRCKPTNLCREAEPVRLRKTNRKSSRVKPRREAAIRASNGALPNAVGVKMDAEEEYWQVAKLLGLVRHT